MEQYRRGQGSVSVQSSTLRNALQWVRTAWRSVSPELVKRAWHRCQILPTVCADDATLSQALSDETATLAELDSNLAELNENLPEEEVMNAEDTLQSLNSLEQSLLTRNASEIATDLRHVNEDDEIDRPDDGTNVNL